jgi:hypothetical protein
VFAAALLLLLLLLVVVGACTTIATNLHLIKLGITSHVVWLNKRGLILFTVPDAREKEREKLQQSRFHLYSFI